MIPLGISRAERRAFEDKLSEDHRIRVRVRILNRDEKPIASLTAPSSRVLDGQVLIDTTQDVTRQLNGLTVLDPRGNLVLDRDGPADVPLSPATMVAVEYGVLVEDWLDVPVFWGPLTRFERSGAEVTIEALGKESLMLPPNVLGAAVTARKGVKVTEAILRVARAAGERRLNIPNLKARLPEHFSVTGREPAWPRLQQLARSVDRQLFYDGAGRLRLRRLPSDPVFRVDEGN
jgi:hypothetical protein